MISGRAAPESSRAARRSPRRHVGDAAGRSRAGGSRPAPWRRLRPSPRAGPRGRFRRDRSASWRQRGPERLGHEFGNPARLGQRPGLLRHRTEQRLLVDFLKRVPIDVRRRQRSGQRHDRRVGGGRLGQTGDEVGRPRPVLAGQEYAGVAGGPRVAVRHVGAGAFVADTDQADGPLVVERVVDLHARRADEPEHRGDALRPQRVDDGLAARD